MRAFKLIQIKQILSGFIACMLLPATAYAGLSKWKDDAGQVHYGDRVPSEYLHKEHSLLNEQGVTVHKSEALKTEEELLLEEEKRKIEQAEYVKRMIAVRKKALRDRVLLDTFTTENDLTIARNARIEAIDSQIALAKSVIESDKVKLDKVKNSIDSISKSGRKAPENLHKKVAIVERQIENNSTYVVDKKSERTEILKTFEYDMNRFRELMTEKRLAREKKSK